MIDAKGMGTGRCLRCKRPVRTIVVQARTGKAHEECQKGHAQ